MCIRDRLNRLCLLISIVTAAILLADSRAIAQGKLVAQVSNDAKIRDTVNEAFRETHAGWSSDEVILDDQLHEAFLSACQERMPDVDNEVFSWTLLTLRKAGKLTTKSTRRKRSDVSKVIHIAEIAARTTSDKFKVSTDRMMVSLEKRSAFDKVALDIDPNAELYLVRKAAFGLRKARKLKPELITRIADWGREIETHTVAQIEKSPDLVPVSYTHLTLPTTPYV